jgi:hypothetical protein
LTEKGNGPSASSRFAADHDAACLFSVIVPLNELLNVQVSFAPAIPTTVSSPLTEPEAEIE